MNQTASHYDLFFHDGTTRFRLYYRDAGIELSDDGIAVRRSGYLETHPFSDVVSVNLTTMSFGGMRAVGQCKIRFRDGLTLVVVSSGASGKATAPTTEAYRAFVAEFHERLAAGGGADRVTFHSGWDDTRHMIQIGLVGVLTVMLIPAPLILMFTGELRPLLVTLAGAAFIWPMWQTVYRNKPGSYSVSWPPDLLA